MNGCFENIISYKGHCETTEPSSGIYTDDIGITALECDDYINEQYASGKDLIEAKINFATETIQKTISSHFSSSIISKSLIENRRLGQYQDNLQSKAGSVGVWGGQHIEFINYNSYFDLFVSEINLQTDFTGNVDVKVYDLIQKKLLETLTVACVAEEVSVLYVNKVYKSNKKRLDLIFIYDTSAVNSYYCALDFQGCGSCVGWKYSNAYVNAWGVTVPDASDKIKSNLTNSSHTSGLSVVYSVQCNNEDWLCGSANIIALPILYKTAAEIMEYSIHNSKRGNTNQTLYYERNKERFAFYSQKANEYLGEVMGRLILPQNDICFSCYTPVKNVIVLP